MIMNKIKRYLKNTINYFKGMRIGTIYKLVGIFLLFAILFWIYSIWKQSNTFKEKNSNNIIINGTVINKGEDYILIEDSAKNEYFIPNVKDENYPIGSEVNANVKDKIESITNDIPITIMSDNVNITNEKIENKNADQEVITYLEETEKYLKDPNFQEEVKIRFIAIVDFLFYNGSINGFTLNDLTAKAKFQILKLSLSIDNKIENYLPGYKETITSTSGKIYTGIKLKVIEMYLNTTTKICKYDQNLCNTAKKDFQDMKQTFSITWNIIKDLISTGADHLKEWYEIYSGK